MTWTLLSLVVIAALVRETAIVYPSRSLWLIAYTLLAVLACASLLPPICARLARVERSFSFLRLRAGEGLAVALSVALPRPSLPCRLEVRDSLPLSLAPYRRPAAGDAYRLERLPRGRYRWERATLIAGDCFGLARFSYDRELPAELIVHPATVELASLAALTAVREQVQRSPLGVEDVTAFKGVRDYRHGDRLASIDWRATARSGSLKTKEFLPVKDRDYLVSLACRRGGYAGEGFEAAVSVAASLLQAALRLGWRGVFLPCGREEATPFELPASPAELTDQLDFLSGLQDDGEAAIAPQCFDGLAAQQILMVAPSQEPAMLALADWALASRRRLCWLAIGPATDYTRRAAGLGALALALPRWRELPQVLAAEAAS